MDSRIMALAAAFPLAPAIGTQQQRPAGEPAFGRISKRARLIVLKVCVSVHFHSSASLHAYFHYGVDWRS
jgi:hypothetical protein